jgi:hypothetical protein
MGVRNGIMGASRKSDVGNIRLVGEIVLTSYRTQDFVRQAKNHG